MKCLNIFACIFAIFLFSCNEERSNKDFILERDTIQVDSFTSQINENNICPELLINYHSKFGIIIQNYFEMDDSLIIDINNDGLLDTLAVFSPVPLEDVSRYDCLIEGASNRILVEILNENGVSKIRNVYPNLISNIGGVLSKYSGIFKTKSGFEIRHESGGRFSWEYITEYSTQTADSISLIKIQKNCSFEGKEKREEYLYPKEGAQNVIFNDTIRNNCNCDSAWSELEQNN